ncbi:MAG: hypothetical protein MZV64_72905 [Ignavibacteriales bacterium]|nr:hypothetical protein [Ignavibacteriales bacterium]
MPFFWTLRPVPRVPVRRRRIVLAVFVVLDTRADRARSSSCGPTHEPPHRRTSFRIEGRAQLPAAAGHPRRGAAVRAAGTRPGSRGSASTSSTATSCATC